MKPSPTWWAPVHRGLVVDPDAKHFRRLGKALWLLLYLILHADRVGGVLARKQATITKDTGIPIRTVRAWMRRLARDRYIAVKGTGRAQRIQILRWMGTKRHKPAGQSGKMLPIRAAETGRALAGNGRNPKQPSDESRQARLPYKIPSTRDLLQQRSRKELVAYDLAEGLDDLAHLPRYRRYATAFPEGILRKVLSQARATSAERIRKSRAALFSYLLSTHAHQGAKDSRA